MEQPGDNYEKLRRAIFKEDIPTIKSILRRDEQILVRNCGGTNPPFHAAIEAQNLEIIQILIKHEKLLVNCQESDGTTPLQLACRGGKKVAMMEVLLENGANVNFANYSDETALHIAMRACDAHVCQLLLEYGADVNVTDAYGNTPLQNAIWNYRKDILPMLLYYNADTTIDWRTHSPWLVLRQSQTMQEMMLPYLSMCNMSALRYCNFSILHELWKQQDKQAFADWCVQQNFKTILNALFSCRYKQPYACDLSSFLHELYGDETLAQFMYDPHNSEHLMQFFPFRYCKENSDLIFSEILRIVLCNRNQLYDDTLVMMQDAFVCPRNTVAVLEDMNVHLVSPFDGRDVLDIVEYTITAPALWHMYSDPDVSTPDVRRFLTDTKLMELHKFYQVVDPLDLAVQSPRSLLELSRNRIRSLCNSKCKYDRNKPYQYASRIKSLGLPSALQNILLLRTPLY